MVIQHLKSSTVLVPFTFSKLYPKFLFPGKSQTDGSLTGSYPRIVSTFNLWSYVGARNQLKKSKPDVLLVNYWMTIFAPMYAFFARGFKKDVLKVALIHNLVPHEKRFFDEGSDPPRPIPQDPHRSLRKMTCLPAPHHFSWIRS